ncbi:NAD(P)-dependent oxidoreductase [Christensenella intestinihominis]|uniref:NAD(P)-dependent oxidoreductase n=1 Tax=Christensenella intestinihominis TaxID=1851429 RepID=UPI00083250B4|nr:NAD(P)-dependent oxidoreductase [Christensenella intestinihominis]
MMMKGYMMKHLKALVTAEIFIGDLQRAYPEIDFEFCGYGHNFKMLTPEELKRKCRNVDIIISEFDTIDESVMRTAQKLKLIICCRAGVKTVIDLDAAKRNGIMVCNNVGRNANAVSDFTIGLILDLTRNISMTNRMIQEEILTTTKQTMPREYQDSLWGLEKESPYIAFRGRGLRNMTLGLVGFGCAGRLVAEKAGWFGMKIIVSDPYVDRTTVPKTVEVVEFEELLQRADIVSVHCAGGKDLKNMFSKEQFRLMKKDAYFINAARGYFVDESALIDALNNGDICGAALDVVNEEPMRPDNPLLEAKNLVITPHIAGSSSDTLRCGTDMVIEALESYLKGERPKHCIIG